MKMQYSNMVRYLSLLLWLWVPALSPAQTSEALLREGRSFYEQDQLDSSRWYYQQAYQIKDPNIQLQAIGGLISLGISRSDLNAADSLVRIGDDLAAKYDLELSALCYYLIRKGEYLRSSSQFPEALAQHREVIRLSAELPDSTLLYADALYYTGLTFEQLSAYDSSLVYVERAFEEYQQALDTTSIKFGNICNGLGVCYYRAGQYEEAKRFYLKSKEIAEQQLGPVSIDLANALSNLSAIYRAEENYQKAITSTEKALKIYRVLEDEGRVSSAYYSLGVYHYFLGDYGPAKSYLEACIEIRELLYEPLHYSLIGPYEVLGIVYEESGDYDQTLYYLRKARPIILHNYGPGNITEAFNYENTAICHQNRGELDSALVYIRRSNRILEPLLSEEDYSLGVHYFNFANIHYLLNNLPEARTMLGQAADIYQKIGLGNSSEYAQNLGLQALMFAEEKNWKRADILFAEALQLIRIPASGQKEREDFKLSPNSLWLLNEYSNYLFQKYQSTGEPEALGKFEDYSQAYLRLSDQFRQQFIDPYTKSILIKDNAEVYSRNIGIYSQLYHQSGRADYLQTAFNFAEYGRTCMLRDLQDEKVESYAGIPDSLLEKELRLRKTISDLNQQLGDDPSDAEAKSALFRAKESLNQYVRMLADVHPEYYDLRFKSELPSLQEIQGKVHPSEVLVEYLQDDTATYALMIHPDLTELVYLGNRDSIENYIIQWQNAIRTQDLSLLQETGIYLYKYLWEPFAVMLPAHRIIIIPAGRLFYLNFEALPLGTTDRYLIQEYTITYALSANILFSPKESFPKNKMVAVAPGFEEQIKQSYVQQLDSLDGVDEAYLRTVRQPWSLKMVKALKKKFANQSYTGLQANEFQVKRSIQKGKILVFGTHAIADPVDPLRSRLILAKEPGEQREDGYLHAYELYGIPLQAELAVLNACESGVGRLQAGEGMISLAYSIHYAGCPSTVMSLWKVDEKVSTQITTVFMNYLSQGLPKSEALRQAKLDYLSSAGAGSRHPFYWAGMVLTGHDGTIDLAEKKSRWPWYVFLGLAGIAMLLYLNRLKKR